MGLSLFFIPTIGAGASPLLAALGMLGMGVGFALANPPTINAAAGVLPSEEVGVGLSLCRFTNNCRRKNHGTK